MRYQEIKAEILNDIRNKLPDSKLESRPTLCKRLKTTRTTLDRAIAELVGEGYLYSQSGSGTYVNNIKRLKTEVNNVENWGVIIPTSDEHVYIELVKGVEFYAAEKQINLILCFSDEDVDKQKRLLQRLMMSNISGMIIVPTVFKNVHEEYQLYRQLNEAKLPFVFCNRQVEGIEAPIVTSNNFYGAYIATKHLIKMGYKKIGFISQKKYKTSEERCKGYVTALLDEGLGIDRSVIVLKENSRGKAPGYRTMERYIKQSPSVDAVFCFNDIIAAGCLEAMNDYSKILSDDIGIIGYDDSLLPGKLRTQISSVSYQSSQIGVKAAEILQKMITGQYSSDFDLYLFQPELTIRESCLGPRKVLDNAHPLSRREVEA